jgi:hypothetical protein
MLRRSGIGTSGRLRQRGKVNSGLLDDMTDEVNAYQTGFLFTSKARGVAEGKYDVNWFKNKIQTDNRYFLAYHSLIGKENSLTVNTPAYLLMDFVSSRDEKNLIIANKGNANYTMLNVMQDVNKIYSHGSGHPPYNLHSIKQQ